MSWKRSSTEAHRMLTAILQNKVLYTSQNVFVNKPKEFLMNWSNEAVKKLSTLADLFCTAREKGVCYISAQKHSKELSEDIVNWINTIIRQIAQLTTYIFQNSIALFNDTFEASLTALINERGKYEYAMKSSDSSLEVLKNIHSLYVKNFHGLKEETINEEIYKSIENKFINVTLNDVQEFCNSCLTIIKHSTKKE
jgi:hypothetical protein